MAKRKAVITEAQVNKILADAGYKPGRSTKAIMSDRTANRKKAVAYTKAGQKRQQDDIKATKKSLTEGTFKGGKNATPETVDYLKRTDHAIKDMEQLTGEKPKEKHKSWYNRGLDLLLRGQYASAEAFRRAGTLEDDKFWDFKAGAEGFKQGFTGKKKTSFSDVLKEHGNTGKGMGTLGFALDIAADPTTYLGFGLVGKAAKGSKEAAEATEKAAKIIGKHAAVNKHLPEQVIQEAVAAKKIPVENLRRRELKALSPEAKKLVTNIAQTRNEIPKNLRNRAAQQNLGKIVKNSDSKPYADFSRIKDTKLRKVAQETFEKEIAGSPGLAKSMRSFKGGRLFGGTMGMAWPKNMPRSVGSFPGKTTLDTRHFADRNWLEQAVVKTMPRGEFAVNAKTSEELTRAVVTHEIGHHAMWAMPDAKVNAIYDMLGKKYGKDFHDYDLLGHNPAGGVVAKKLSKYGATDQREMFAEAWSAYRVLGDKASPMARRIGKAVEKELTEGLGEKTQRELIESLAKDTHLAGIEKFQDEVAQEFHAAGRQWEVPGQAVNGRFVTPHDQRLADEIAKEATKRAKAAGVHDVDKLQKELFKNAGANLSTKTKRELAIRVGGAKFAIPGVAAVTKVTAEQLMKPAFIRKSVQTFNNAFRANAYIPESLRHLRTQTHSIGANLVREYGHEIKNVWDAVPKAVRKDIGIAWAKGHTKGISHPGGVTGRTGLPVDNVMDELEAGMQDLHKQIIDLGANQGITAKDLNKFLPENMHLSHIEIKKSGPKAEQLTRGKYKPDFFLEDVKRHFINGKIDDPARALYQYTIAVNQAVAHRKLWDVIGEIHGAPLSANKLAGGTFGDTLAKKQGWVKATYGPGKESIHGLDNVVFEPEVAAALSRMAEVFNSSKSTGDFIRHYDRALMSVKSILTRYNPAFTPRTLMGEVLLGYLGGMKNIPHSYHMATKVLRGRNQEFLGLGAPAVGASKRVVQSSNVIRGISQADAAEGGSRVVMRHSRFGTLNADELWHHFMNSGLKSGFASTDMVRGVEETIGGSVLRKISDKSQALNESVEDVGRLAHFIDGIRYSKAKTLEEAIEESAMQVRKSHLDYTEVTQFEKNVATRMIPFYKWLKMSTPLMAEILLTQPGKALVLPKAINSAARMAGYDPNNSSVFPGGPDAAVPDYLVDAGAQPVGEFGTKNSQWFNPATLFPAAGSTALVEKAFDNPFKAFMDVVNPIASGVAETGLDKQNMGAAPSDNKAKYVANLTPQTAYAYKAAGNGDPDVSQMENFIKFLTNIGFQSNTPTTIQSAAKRQNDAANAERREAKRRAGLLEPKK